MESKNDTIIHPLSAVRMLIETYPVTMERAGRLCVQRGMTDEEAALALGFTMYMARKDQEEKCDQEPDVRPDEVSHEARQV